MVSYMLVALSLLAVGSPVLAGSDESDDEAIKSCLAMMTPENIQEQCCETMILSGPEKENYIRECGNSENSEWTCENMQCILDKYGMMDGANINDKKVVEKLKDMENKDPRVKDMTQQIRKLCMEGKQYDEFPPEDCPASRFWSCIYIAAFPACSTWKETAKCKEIAMYAKTCKTAMETMKDKK